MSRQSERGIVAITSADLNALLDRLIAGWENEIAEFKHIRREAPSLKAEFTPSNLLHRTQGLYKANR